MAFNNTFGIKLNNLRTSRHLTSAELADRASVPPSLISGLQSGTRVVGEYTARKIGKALHLTGEELEDFIYLAINGCSEKVLNASKAYPAILINLVASKLQEQGISPDEINQCVRRPKKNDADAALYLDNGKEAFIKLEVAYA